jgi:demethylmenaquinone methyltransferase/2-methoxy-6-polyprenyl-1,4-benzoquinol methylase
MYAPSDSRIIDEQIAYYRARAGEYDEWWFRTGRYDRGAELNAAWVADAALVERALCDTLDARRPARALELACGTGLFTRHLAPRVAHLTALDASPEVIAINRSRVAAGNVEYALADLFEWQPDARYDFVFMSFWLSHVPLARFDPFWRIVARALAPGGIAYVIDSAHEPTSTAIDHAKPSETAGIVERKTNDGNRYRVVKIFWEPAVLAQRLAPLGFASDVARTPRYFIHGTVRPSA